MFDPIGKRSDRPARDFQVNRSVKTRNPSFGEITEVFEADGQSNYTVNVKVNASSTEKDYYRLPVGVGQHDEGRGLEVGSTVIVEHPEGADTPIVSKYIQSDGSIVPLVKERDWRVVKDDKLIEIVRNDYDQLMLNVGRVGDRQPDSKHVTRSGMDMGLMQNLSSGAFRFFDGSGMGLSGDGKGNFVWNWATMTAPNAIYGGGSAGGGGGPSGQAGAPADFRDVSTYGGIGGGESYTQQTPKESADTVVSPTDDLSASITSATNGETIFFTGDHDFTGNHANLTANNVTVASNRGVNGATGGTIIETTNSNSHNNSCINVTGNGCLLDSFRVAGPVTQYQDYSGTLPASGAIIFKDGASNGEVANCHINGFTVNGVGILDSGPTHTHHCAITGIKIKDRGYGVRHQNCNGENLHEFNYFDDCRHSVKGGGKVGEIYKVRDCIFGPTAHNHQLDVHADDTRSGFHAGQHYEVHNCEIRQTEESGQEVARARGIPSDLFDFYNNIVWMNDRSQAVRQSRGPGGDAVFASAAEPNKFQNMRVRGNKWGREGSVPSGVGPRVKNDAQDLDAASDT